MDSFDSKTKAILQLIRALVVVTMLVLALAVLVVFYSVRSGGIDSTPPPLGCGTCNTSAKMKSEYTINGRDGKALFKANCSSCHTATDKNSTGPGLKGVLDRIPGGEWKYIYVRDHDSLVRAGDPYAVALFEKYKRQVTRFPQLTNDEIDAILEYSSISHATYY